MKVPTLIVKIPMVMYVCVSIVFIHFNVLIGLVVVFLLSKWCVVLIGNEFATELQHAMNERERDRER